MSPPPPHRHGRRPTVLEPGKPIPKGLFDTLRARAVSAEAVLSMVYCEPETMEKKS